jgi:hypothetical protein
MAKRIELYYGPTGSAKSESLAAVIEQLFVQDGLVSRVAIGDGSKATYIDRGLVDAGIVELLDYSIRDWPTTTLSRLAEGYWPADVNDPKSPLLKPTVESFSNLGVMGFEGLSVGAQYLMGDRLGGYAEQSARGIKIGQDSPVMLTDGLLDPKTGKLIPGSGPGDTYGGNPISHYGFVQRRMLGIVERTKVFPNIVIWTAHERSVTDKVSGEKLIGPEAGGEALTASLPRYFNNTLHFTSVAVTKQVKDGHTDKQLKELDVEYRIYTRDHYSADPGSPTMTKYKAVTRGTSPETMPEFLTSKVPGEAILKFYQQLADRRGGRAAELQQRRAEALAKKAA